MTSSVPAVSESRVMPRRSSVFGVPPSTIHSSHFWPAVNWHACGPSALGTSMWIQACGFTHSSLTTLPLSSTGRFGSNSPPKAWCPTSGTPASTIPNPAIVIVNLARMRSLLLFALLGVVGFLEPRALENVLERVVAFVARVFVQAILGCRPRVLAGPRLSPRVLIFNRKPILQRLVVDAREPFDDVQVGC